MSTSRSGRTRIEELRSFKSAALSDANRHLVRRVQGSIAPEQEWEFFCECGAETCYQQVFLTLDAYIALREDGRAVLARDHRVSQVERARELRLEAEALRRQADHQLKRAQRNLRDRPDT